MIDNIVIISNIIYLVCGIYLILNKLYIFGLIAILIWIVSHNHHTKYTNHNYNLYWKITDRIIATIAILYLLYKYHKTLSKTKICILLFILMLFILARVFNNLDNMNGYNICHSLWHITSAIFITYIIKITFDKAQYNVYEIYHNN